MIKKKKILIVEELPEFEASIEAMPEDSRIFVDKSMEIADYIFRIMELKGMKQKDLAVALGKTEAEISKWLTGMHNYTLRSLSKIEAALHETIICTPENNKAVSLIYSKRRNAEIIDQYINNKHSTLDYNAKVISIKSKQNNVVDEQSNQLREVVAY